MNKELQNKLYNKYPKIFRQKDLSMQETCMNWGIDCDDGWFNLLDCLCSNIQRRIDDPHQEKVKSLPKDFYNFVIKKINNGLFGLSRLVEGRKWNETGWRVMTMQEAEARRPICKNLEKFAMNIPRARYKFKKIEICQVEATQVKEKLAGLRFYVQGGNDEIYNYISFAESMSYKTCECCGNPGYLCDNRGWYKTLCDACINKQTHKYVKTEEVIE